MGGVSDLFSGGGFGDFLSGVGSAVGQFTAAGGSRVAASYYFKAADLTGLETSLKETAASRQIYQTLGAGQADVAANGLLQSGSAADVMRSSAQQGALSKAVIQLQGSMQQQSYIAQGRAAQQQAHGSSIGGILGAVGAVASLFSDDRLKRNAVLLARRSGDGLGIWQFQYVGNDEWYQGVMASEVELLYPDAVTWEDGWRKVDYAAIGMEMLRVGGIEWRV